MKAVIEKIVWYINGGYKPKLFWERWGKTFIEDPWQHNLYKHHREIINFVKKNKPKKILDLGCGFGRNIKFLLENNISEKNIVGVDISSSMLKQAKKFLKPNLVNLVCASASKIPFKNNSFDLVLIDSLLMHIKPLQLGKVLEEIKRVGKKDFIIIEQNYMGDKKSMRYTFLHNYKKEFYSHNFKIVKKISYKKEGYDMYFLTLGNS